MPRGQIASFVRRVEDGERDALRVEVHGHVLPVALVLVRSEVVEEVEEPILNREPAVGDACRMPVDDRRWIEDSFESCVPARGTGTQVFLVLPVADVESDIAAAIDPRVALWWLSPEL